MAWRQAHCIYAGGVIVRSCAVGAIVAAALAACGGTSSTPMGATPGGTETRSATAAAPEHPLPPELQGSWLLESGPTTDLVRLYLRQTTYTASRGGGSHAGQVAVNGSVMEFTSLCGASSVEGVGRYHWTLAGDNLHLDLIGKDECSGRSAILEDATYKRHG
jgi:hypothetical protein